MSEELKAYFQEHYKQACNPKWHFGLQVNELAQWALEAGFGDLPKLDMGDGDGIPQKEFDREIESAYLFLQGEARHFLQSIQS